MFHVEHFSSNLELLPVRTHDNDDLPLKLIIRTKVMPLSEQIGIEQIRSPHLQGTYTDG